MQEHVRWEGRCQRGRLRARGEERGGRDSSERGESGGEEKGSHYWAAAPHQLLRDGDEGGTKKTKIREDWEEVLWSWKRLERFWAFIIIRCYWVLVRKISW